MLLSSVVVAAVVLTGQLSLRTPVPPVEPGSSAASPLALGRGIEVPARAVERMVSGRAVVRCDVSSAGRLTACTVVEETPPGFGFGREVIRAASRTQVPADSPWIGRTAYFGAAFHVQ